MIGSSQLLQSFEDDGRAFGSALQAVRMDPNGGTTFAANRKVRMHKQSEIC